MIWWLNVLHCWLLEAKYCLFNLSVLCANWCNCKKKELIMDCRDNFIEQEHYTRQTIWHSFFNWRFFSLACISLLQTPCYSTPLSLYWSSSGFVCETWDRNNRARETDERVTARADGKGRLMGVDEVKEWRYFSSFFIRASFAIMCPSSKWEIAQFVEGLPSPTWDNLVSSIQQPALFSEVGSNTISGCCFQQHCNILI